MARAVRDRGRTQRREHHGVHDRRWPRHGHAFAAPLDPGVIIHVMSHYGLDLKAVEDMLYKRSGLIGVSGISSDMRSLRASDDPGREAIDLFVYRIRRRSARTPPRSAGSTRSSSRRASARTTRRRDARSRRAARGSASRSTKRRIQRANSRSARRRARTDLCRADRRGSCIALATIRLVD